MHLISYNLISLGYIWFKYDKGIIHPKFDLTLVRTHYLQIMDSSFHVLEMNILTNETLGTFFSDNAAQKSNVSHHSQEFILAGKCVTANAMGDERAQHICVCQIMRYEPKRSDYECVNLWPSGHIVFFDGDQGTQQCYATLMKSERAVL